MSEQPAECCREGTQARPALAPGLACVVWGAHEQQSGCTESCVLSDWSWPWQGRSLSTLPPLLCLLSDSLAAGWAVRVLSLAVFVFLLFKLVKWSHSLSDSMTSRSSVRLGHGNGWLGLRRRRLCWVSLCSLPMKHKWNHFWVFRAVPRTTAHCLSCLCKPCYRWRPLQTGTVGLFKEINVNKSPCECSSSPCSVLNALHRTWVEV